ncbi:MAG TPA: phosphoenolpyruvate--protein phosphotransferase [Candidatus Sulfotelmatobacter sp.]|nr:phosphoenolpyruvate--protein phosphotransferase [Candidatus Sulfotelmatobacter sp.]
MSSARYSRWLPVISAGSGTGRRLQGIAGAPGRVAGPIWRWPEDLPVSDVHEPASPDGAALRCALELVRSQLSAAAAKLREAGAANEAGIIDAQLLVLDDPAFTEVAFSAIARGVAPAQAVQSALDPFIMMLLQSPDPVFRGRADDLRDVARQLCVALRGGSGAAPNPERPSIVVARDLAPSQTAGLDQNQVLGFATEMGSATAHTAILARALGIPAVVGVSGLLGTVREGQMTLLDGDLGCLILDPPPEAVEVAARRSARSIENDPWPAITRDGHRIEVGCNVAGLEDARRAAAAGADGIGLLRSEFLFLGRDTLPDEQEQVELLTQIMRILEGRPVILRTLDVGADKRLPALAQPSEANPALGVRGLRLELLRRKDLLAQQLRAAIRVARDFPIRVMFPMVATVAEVREAKVIFEKASQELGVVASLQIGVMIEVPSAALAAEALAREVDFFSLGTNDLTQYVFAADRTNPELAHLADSLHPVLLGLIQTVVDGAHRHQKWVGVCGEMASDPWALPLLIGLGVDELSVHPPLVAQVKARVRGLKRGDCTRAAGEALELEDGQQVRGLLSRQRLEPPRAD